MRQRNNFASSSVFLGGRGLGVVLEDSFLVPIFVVVVMI